MSVVLTTHVILSLVCCEIQTTLGQNVYVRVEPGQNITGKIIASDADLTSMNCATWCSFSNQCEMFQHTAPRQGNCTLISKTSAGVLDTFTATGNNLIYRQECSVRPWPEGNDPVFYFCFDFLYNVQLMEETVMAEFYPLVDGKLNKAIATDYTKKQWVDLGDLSDACITIPDSCGPEGAAISFWINLINCTEWGTIIRSKATGKTGFSVRCFGHIRYYLFVSSGKFTVYEEKPIGWTHIVLNLIGSDDGQGFKVYYNGQYQGWAKNRDNQPSGTGNGLTAVGKGKIGFEMDELAFFNRKLSSEQILKLFKLNE